jgi:hypothetical protein
VAPVNAPVGAYISFGLAAILAVGVVWLTLEGVLIRSNQAPITTYVRTAVLRHTVPTTAVWSVFVLVVGLLTAHFFWDAGCG